MDINTNEEDVNLDTKPPIEEKKPNKQPSNSTQLGIPTLDNMDWFQLPGSFLIIAKKYVGKSHLMKWILYNFVTQNKFDYGIVISKTAKATHEWDVVDNNKIYDEWDEDIVWELIEYQKQQKALEHAKKIKRAPRCFILFDDIIGFVDMKTKVIASLASAGRHFGITTFFLTQKMTDAIPPVVRQNAEYVFILKNSNLNELQEIHREWTNDLFPDLNSFRAFMNQNVVDYNVLVINKRSPGNNPLDNYRFIKAPEKIPSFFLKINKKKEEQQVTQTVREDPLRSYFHKLLNGGGDHKTEQSATLQTAREKHSLLSSMKL